MNTTLISVRMEFSLDDGAIALGSWSGSDVVVNPLTVTRDALCQRSLTKQELTAVGRKTQQAILQALKITG